MKTKPRAESPRLRDKKHRIARNATKKSIGAVLCGLLMTAGAHAATLKVDKDRSRIQVDAKATGHSFTGTLEDYTAKVTGDASSLAPRTFELNWTFDRLKTGDEKRDKEMIHWLGGGTPAGSFKFTKSWKDEQGRDFAMGTLKIHGVSKTISFPFSVKRDGDWVSIDGTASLNYKDFSLPIIRAMAVMTVDPQLSVRFHVVGKL